MLESLSPVNALCMILHDGRLCVAPFKSENVSLVSYAEANGGEIGRAQMLQAIAAPIPPHVRQEPDASQARSRLPFPSDRR